MQIPASISQRSLGLLGGNTMHLHCIGIVLLMGIALLKQELPPRPISDDSGKMPEIAFIKTVATTARGPNVSSVDICDFRVQGFRC